MIRFLKNDEIDRAAWDKCISSSRQRLIYGMSWYLDLVSPGWCAVAKDNYSAVMPLPVKKKYGIPYIVQPVYAQQLGVFSENTTPVEEISEFLNSIPRQYQYIAMNLNSGNKDFSWQGSLKMNTNFELRLDKEYETLESSFSANTRRNLQKTSDLLIHFEGNTEELLRLKAENTGVNRKRIPGQIIRELIRTVMANGSGFFCSAVDGNQTCASVFFLRDEKRIYYLIPVSNQTGKEKKAMFAIISEVIRKYAGSQMILDFEGSNIPGIARFFEGFAASNNSYPAIKMNRMPFPLNQFRKT